MLAAIVGIVALCLLFLAVGGFMEGDMRKVARFGVGFAICAVISAFSAVPNVGSPQDCQVDWDSRANSEVCD